jgi:hypothetical protein
MPTRRTGTGGQRRSAHAEADAQISQLRDLEGDAAAQESEALRLLEKSKHLQVVQAALAVLGASAHPGLRAPLHAKYAWCSQKGDPGGFIRAGIIHALRPIAQWDELPIFYQAVQTYEYQGMYELCAGVRAAALLGFLDLDPGLAAMHAARLLNDPQNSFSEEPAMTAVGVLGATSTLAPLFAYACFAKGNSAVLGEALRKLEDVPAEMVAMLVATHGESDDEQVLLGLFDLLLAHRDRDRWRPFIEGFMETTSLIDLYGIVAMQIVASRDEPLIAHLRELSESLLPREREYLLEQALRHA